MLQLAVTVEGAGDAGLITKEETTAAGFLADQRHQLLIRNEGAVVHMGNKYSSMSKAAFVPARYISDLVPISFVLNKSSILAPPLHQLPDASLPDGNSGAHQSRCDLVNVGGNTTDTSHKFPDSLV